MVTSDAVAALLDDEAVVDALLPLLPDGHRTREELYRTASSPHLASALRSLSKALNSANFPTVMANFQLTGGDALVARGDGVGAFLAASQELVDRVEAEDAKGAPKDPPASS